MTATVAHAPPFATPLTSAEAPGADLACRRCGGSGSLRLGDDQYRTCLDCLGQGRHRPCPEDLLPFPSLSVAVGASDAR